MGEDSVLLREHVTNVVRRNNSLSMLQCIRHINLNDNMLITLSLTPLRSYLLHKHSHMATIPTL
jgi:hypothetical protein